MDGQASIVWARTSGRKPPPRPQASRRIRQPRPLLNGQAGRDLVLFLAGLAGLFHQFAIAPEPQEILVAAALALIFGPVPFRLDERRRNGANGS